MLATTTSTWASEKAQWRSHFTNILSHQVKRLNALVLEKKHTPDTLRNHFDSILKIFQDASTHPDPATRLELLTLVHNLHPLPVWWGKWSAWIRILNTATHIAQKTESFNEEIWLELTQAEMLLSSGNAENSLVLSQKAHALALLKNNPEMLFRAEIAIFEAKKFLGLSGEPLNNTLSLLEKSLAEKKMLLPEKKAQELEIELILQKIEVVRKQGNTQIACKLATQAHQLAEFFFDENDLFMAKIFATRGSTYWANREYDLAIESCQKSIGLFQYWGDHTSQVETSGRLGLYYWSTENHEAAENALQSSVEMAEAFKLLAPQAIHSGNLALVHFSRGQLNQALALTQQHYTLSKLTNDHHEIRRARGNMGAIQIHLGDFQNALENLRADHEHAKEAQLRQPFARLYAKIAWALDGLGLFDEAMEHAEKSLFLAEKMDEPLVKLMALRSLSEVTNDKDDKIRYAEEARALAKKHSRRLNEAGALLTLAHSYREDSFRNEAEEILDEIGARDWLKTPIVFETLRLPLLL